MPQYVPRSCADTAKQGCAEPPDTIRRACVWDQEQYAKKGSKQGRQLKDNASKVASLEKSLGQMMKDFEVERDALKEKARTAADASKVEADGLRRLLKLKSRELNNIRRLAQEVVRQRTDTETFLIDSLAFVREQIYQEQVQGERDSLEGGLPPIGAGRGQGAGGSTGPNTPTRSREKRLATGKLDIRDLGWEDREKVMRLLFSKINHASQQTYFGNLPPHSFEMDGVYEEDGDDGEGEFPPPPPGYGADLESHRSVPASPERYEQEGPASGPHSHAGPAAVV